MEGKLQFTVTIGIPVTVREISNTVHVPVVGTTVLFWLQVQDITYTILQILSKRKINYPSLPFQSKFGQWNLSEYFYFFNENKTEHNIQFVPSHQNKL